MENKTPMNQRKLLIVEDTIAEAIYAQAAAARAGYTEFRAVTTLEEALRELPSYDVVVSDLFFPVGAGSTQAYSARFLPFYEAYKKRAFPEIGQEAQCVREAVKAVAEIFELSPEEYVTKKLPALGYNATFVAQIQDAFAGRKNAGKYQQFLGIEQQVREGTLLPLGIIVSERAQQLGKPVVIVTSTYHHDDAFEPIAGQIPCGYVDTLAKGRKDWKKGLEKLVTN
jgi:CheY-like chemotaxis protein